MILFSIVNSFVKKKVYLLTYLLKYDSEFASLKHKKRHLSFFQIYYQNTNSEQTL